jgi:aspartyl-tRNA(Asn)/glutamyl-tRNA(Gln) amidotransferase subunit C
MSDPITPDSFTHLVHLAALELDPQESEYLRQELNNQLKAINELEIIPLDESIPITTHGVAYTPLTTPSTRMDEILSCPNPSEILDQAPETDEGYIVVPDIPHTELE